jgi:hypothetical protein
LSNGGYNPGNLGNLGNANGMIAPAGRPADVVSIYRHRRQRPIQAETHEKSCKLLKTRFVRHDFPPFCSLGSDKN